MTWASDARRPRRNADGRLGNARSLYFAATSISALVGAAMLLTREWYLPPKFDYDADKIQNLALGLAAVDDDSFSGVAAVYRVLGLANRPLLAGFLGYGAALALVALAQRAFAGARVSRSAFVVTAASIGLASVYMGAYSKELLVLPISALVLMVPGRRGLILSAIAMAAYASSFRTYWWIVLCAYLGFYYALRRIRRPIYLLFLVIGVLVSLTVAYMLVTGHGLSEIRNAVNTSRLESADAATRINQYIPGSSIQAQSLNAVVTLVFLVLPAPLVLIGTPYHVLVAVGVGALWIYAAARIVTGVRSGRFANSVVARRAAALLVAFVVTQAIFEPDYGSALRHAVPLLSLVLALAFRDDVSRLRCRESEVDDPLRVSALAST